MGKRSARRREGLRLLAAAALVALAGCRRAERPEGELRLGFFPTLTHAVPLSLLERGTLARALAPVVPEPRAFNSGPEVIEALFAGALDAAYVGPVPALNGYLRSHGQALHVVAGAAQGGSALVVRDPGITRAAQLHGRTLASPQLGNTQDVALRTYLRENGLESRDRGGDVKVVPLTNPEIIQLMRLGRLDGAWVVEPWVSRLVHEAGAHVIADERALVPEGSYPTAVLVATRSLVAEPALLGALLRAHVDEIAWIEAHRDEARELVGEAVKRLTRQALPPEVLADAWARVRFDPQVPRKPFLRLAAQARALRYLPREGDPSAAFDTRVLDATRAQQAPAGP